MDKICGILSLIVPLLSVSYHFFQTSAFILTQLGNFNYLELKAIYNNLLTLLPHVKDSVAKIMSDNMCAVFYINTPKWSLLALDIFNILIQYNITYHSYHLPGCENYNADWLSRSFSNYNNDFSLSHQASACVIV